MSREEDVRRVAEFCARPGSEASRWYKVGDGSRPVLEAAQRLLSVPPLTPPDAEPKPKGRVLMLRQYRGCEKPAWIMVKWYERGELSADNDYWTGECEEGEDGEPYCPAGWYELTASDGPEDVEAWAINGELFGWVPLPEIPEVK